MYQLLSGDPISGRSQCVKRLSDSAFIPLENDSTDYQEYLRWLEEGNTPLPADEPPTE